MREVHQDVRVLFVEEDAFDVVVAVYGGPDNICGSVRLTADDADHRARQLRLLHRWASESTPLTFVMSEDRVALVNDRALVERLLEPTN